MGRFFVVVVLATLASLALAQTPAVLEELAGTYRTTLVYEDLTAQKFYDPTDVVGTWTVTFSDSGHLAFTYRSASSDRGYEIDSVYVVYDGRIYVGAETGAYRCQDMYGITAGVYTWSRQADASLALTAVEDECVERRIVFTAKPLAREPD